MGWSVFRFCLQELFSRCLRLVGVRVVGMKAAVTLLATLRPATTLAVARTLSLAGASAATLSQSYLVVLGINISPGHVFFSEGECIALYSV